MQDKKMFRLISVKNSTQASPAFVLTARKDVMENPILVRAKVVAVQIISAFVDMMATASNTHRSGLPYLVFIWTY